MTDAGDAPKIPRDSAQDSPRARDDGGSAARRAGFVVVITVVVTAVVIWLFGARAYDWIKAVHVIAVMSWMAGLLYLPRLFIYHCAAPRGSTG